MNAGNSMAGIIILESTPIERMVAILLAAGRSDLRTCAAKGTLPLAAS